MLDLGEVEQRVLDVLRTAGEGPRGWTWVPRAPAASVPGAEAHIESWFLTVNCPLSGQFTVKNATVIRPVR